MKSGWGQVGWCNLHEVDAGEEGLVVLGRFIKDQSPPFFNIASEKRIPTTPCQVYQTY